VTDSGGKTDGNHIKYYIRTTDSRVGCCSLFRKRRRFFDHVVVGGDMIEGTHLKKQKNKKNHQTGQGNSSKV